MKIDIEITNEFLRSHLTSVGDHWMRMRAEYGDSAQPGIVPDLCREILRLRGEPVPPLPEVPDHHHEFVKFEHKPGS